MSLTSCRAAPLPRHHFLHWLLPPRIPAIPWLPWRHFARDCEGFPGCLRNGKETRLRGYAVWRALVCIEKVPASALRAWIQRAFGRPGGDTLPRLGRSNHQRWAFHGRSSGWDPGRPARRNRQIRQNALFEKLLGEGASEGVDSGRLSEVASQAVIRWSLCAFLSHFHGGDER